MNALLSGRRSLLLIYALSLLAYALLMWPAYEWARWRLERFFNSERLDHLQALRDLARTRRCDRRIAEIESKLTRLVHRALNATTVSLLEPQGGRAGLFLAASNGVARSPSAPAIGASSPVVLWLQERRTALPTRAFDVEPLLQNIPEAERAALADLHASVLAPLLTTHNVLSGILVLGPKTSRRQVLDR